MLLVMSKTGRMEGKMLAELQNGTGRGWRGASIYSTTQGGQSARWFGRS